MPRLAQGATNTVAAMLAEQVPHAEIDLIDVIFGHIKEGADRLCRFVAECFINNFYTPILSRENEIVN